MPSAAESYAQLSGYQWGQTGQPYTLTYSFPTSAAEYGSRYGSETSGTVSALNATQQAMAVAAMQTWANVANITLVPVAQNGEIRFAFTTGGFTANGGTIAHAYYPSGGSRAGDIWLNGYLKSDTDYFGGSPSPTSAGMQTLIHEFGHALGLEHPFSSSGNFYAPEISTVKYTTMSYSDYAGHYDPITGSFSGGGATVNPSTPMLYDIAAIQYLYGANYSYHAGNDTYTFSQGGTYYQTIWDGGGTDTIQFTGTSAVEIDLREGEFSQLGNPISYGSAYAAQADTVAIAYGVTIENATGGSGNDTLYGNNADNTLDGGAGNDTLSGFGGNDTYLVGSAGDSVIEAANAGIDTVRSSLTWTLGLNVENLVLTGSAQLNATGNELANSLSGNSANNVLSGLAGNDVLIGGANTLALAIGTAYTPAGAIGANWNIIGTADVSSDGKADYVWTNAGRIAIWTIANGVLTDGALINAAIGSEWVAKTTGDFNHDGLSDVLWVNAGRVAVWELSGANVIAGGVSNGQIGADFNFRTVGDFSGDGNSDVLWHSNTGQVAMWMMQDASIISGGVTSAAIGTDWSIGGTGDFNGDGRDDVLWYNASGQAVTWLVNGTSVTNGAISGTIGAGWKVGGISDLNMDGKADIAWVNPTNNAVTVWTMNGTSIAGTTTISSGGAIGTDWKFAGLGDVTGDSRADVVWTRPNGSSVIWDLQGNGDQLSGGAGRDVFQFNALTEMGKVITDFQAGAGGDILGMHDLLAAVGYAGTNPLQDGQVRLVQDGTKTEVQVDAHPGAHDYVTAATLQNTTASSLTGDNWTF